MNSVDRLSLDLDQSKHCLVRMLFVCCRDQFDSSSLDKDWRITMNIRYHDTVLEGMRSQLTQMPLMCWRYKADVLRETIHHWNSLFWDHAFVLIERKTDLLLWITCTCLSWKRNGSFYSSVVDKRGTTVMLLVASVAFLILLGPFYVHWCVTYLFYNYPQCHFTRNLYENVQVCMGIFHPYLTVIEKGMRESNHAINFLLYWATSTRFRSDFKRLCRQLLYRGCGSVILFLWKHFCFFWAEPTWLNTLERQVSDATEQDSSYESNRKNQTFYKTSHYYTNYERRRRQHQLVQETLLNGSLATDNNLTPTTSFHTLTANTSKTVRMLTWNPHDPMMLGLENKRRPARVSRDLSVSKATWKRFSRFDVCLFVYLFVKVRHYRSKSPIVLLVDDKNAPPFSTPWQMIQLAQWHLEKSLSSDVSKCRR